VDLVKAVMCAIEKRVPRIAQLHEYANTESGRVERIPGENNM